MDALPDDVRRFVLAHISSVPYLEGALLLRREPARVFSAAEVASALYLTRAAAEELLQALQDNGLAAREAQGLRWQPREPATAEAMDALADAYARNLVAVTLLIHDATRRKAQRFADAFKLRKDR